MTPLLLLLAACTPEPLPGPGLLLVTVDTWRADHLHRKISPNAWALGERGARFENAWSPIGLTTAAHASLMTGQLPPTHGLRGNNHHGYALPLSADTLAEQLSRAGWATGAFVSAYPAGPSGGMAQGFAQFSAPMVGERPGDVAIAEASAWLEAREGPWFAWVHLYEPHGPYAPPASDLARVGGDDDRARYAAEVHAADRLLGPLLKRALDSGAWVLLTSDHGEVLDEERCGWQHERSSSATVLRVPMLLAGPGVEAGQVRAEQVGLVDVMPTALRLAGLPDPGGHDGRDLLQGAPREAWVGESGLCDPECAQGCSPAGFRGKDRVAYGAEGGVLVDRPGRPPWGDLRLRGHLDGYAPVTEEPVSIDLTEKVQGLGYVDPPR